ncbi:MAG: hypothetical protein M1833_006386 [Piccolia ochrophora]|nr:MAG: hypothetical protein M1833_006386 [Piccolia ochrophora]
MASLTRMKRQHSPIGHYKSPVDLDQITKKIRGQAKITSLDEEELTERMPQYKMATRTSNGVFHDEETPRRNDIGDEADAESRRRKGQGDDGQVLEMPPIRIVTGHTLVRGVGYCEDFV